MTSKDFANLKTWFENYVSGFYKNDPEYDFAIKLKKEHTERVCQNIVQIGQALNLPDNEMIMAESIALFHDLGRFRQYALYHTFRDADSENHARLSVRELALNKVLADCTISERRTIIKAVNYHNALALPENADEKDLFFMKMIRDADKLDIWGVFARHYQNGKRNSVLELGLPDTPGYSENAVNALNERRMVNMADMASLNDFKLLQLSWVFDLNFPASIKIAGERGDVEIIAASLPESKEIAEAFEEVRNYIASFE